MVTLGQSLLPSRQHLLVDITEGDDVLAEPVNMISASAAKANDPHTDVRIGSALADGSAAAAIAAAAPAPQVARNERRETCDFVMPILSTA